MKSRTPKNTSIPTTCYHSLLSSLRPFYFPRRNAYIVLSRLEKGASIEEACRHIDHQIVENNLMVWLKTWTTKCTEIWNKDKKETGEICSSWGKEITQLEKEKKFNIYDDNYQQQSIPINEKLIKSFHQSPEELTEKAWETVLLDSYKNDPKLSLVPETELIKVIKESKIELQQEMKKDRPFFLAQIMREATHRLIAEKKGLKCSTWSPKAGSLSLVRELKNKGPMTVGGCFGQYFYTKPSFALTEKINGLTVHGWPLGSRSTTYIERAHTVVLVGARILKDNTYVYFVDPADESDPKLSQSRKVYVMSYKTFCENLASTYGVPTKENPSSLGYAFFNPNFMLNDYIRN